MTSPEADTDSDLMLAQMLQMEFDREFDSQLRREEKKFNGDSKGERMDLDSLLSVTAPRMGWCSKSAICQQWLSRATNKFVTVQTKYL